ncbi:unnamed protein product [Effrenium voratum]|uniref:Uncharacterized protein n=1 Tax=Effrenium voratum TaxID=2562239 RepID=A0AA36HWH6_9DINO|nr:unnamed protein product [Effrenium voratum]CAJ1380227.1 unnamed protein product [Effrenium voratum]CAJ1413764.1 unnamed protein product [Effrenium voratum]
MLDSSPVFSVLEPQGCPGQGSGRTLASAQLDGNFHSEWQEATLHCHTESMLGLRQEGLPWNSASSSINVALPYFAMLNEALHFARSDHERHALRRARIFGRHSLGSPEPPNPT